MIDRPSWAGQPEQINPLKYFGGVAWWDNYASHSPEDSDQWLRIFELAHNVSPDLSACLMMIRNTGARLVADSQFGFRIQPVIGRDGWASREEYDRERVFLGKYREQVIEILGKVAGL